MFRDFETGRFYKGDCLEVMKEIPDNCINMILCDLPYGTTQNKWDTIIPFDKLWTEYNRICNGAVVLTASQPFTSALVMSNPKMFKHEWIWQKDKGSNFANTVREPMKEHESVLVFCKGKWTYNKQMEKRAGKHGGKLNTNGGFVDSTNYGKGNEERLKVIVPELRVPSSVQKINIQTNKIHPTQKPVALFEYLIKTYSNEGMLVLDNCAGSGTTAIACQNTNRKWVCIEQDETYFNAACERIENAHRSAE